MNSREWSSLANLVTVRRLSHVRGNTIIVAFFRLSAARSEKINDRMCFGSWNVSCPWRKKTCKATKWTTNKPKNEQTHESAPYTHKLFWRGFSCCAKKLPPLLRFQPLRLIVISCRTVNYSYNHSNYNFHCCQCIINRAILSSAHKLFYCRILWAFGRSVVSFKSFQGTKLEGSTLDIAPEIDPH